LSASYQLYFITNQTKWQTLPPLKLRVTTEGLPIPKLWQLPLATKFDTKSLKSFSLLTPLVAIGKLPYQRLIEALTEQL
jgi:hypothetical protein